MYSPRMTVAQKEGFTKEVSSKSWDMGLQNLKPVDTEDLGGPCHNITQQQEFSNQRVFGGVIIAGLFFAVGSILDTRLGGFG